MRKTIILISKKLIQNIKLIYNCINKIKKKKDKKREEIKKYKGRPIKISKREKRLIKRDILKSLKKISYWLICSPCIKKDLLNDFHNFCYSKLFYSTKIHLINNHLIK